MNPSAPTPSASSADAPRVHAPRVHAPRVHAPRVHAKTLTKSFRLGDREVPVLTGVDLDLDDGDALAVTGPSGSGKSTLLHILGTLDTADGGRLLLDGTDPSTLAERDLARFRNRTVGFVFQDHHLLPQYSVLENVLLPALAFPDGREGADERARELLRRVGLAERLDHRPAALSGGERQRAAVARALVNRPRLLLCDEPTGSLDPATAERVADLLFELHEGDPERVLVVVTHSEALAGRFPRRCRLREGRCGGD
jgi:lipoprotein-releasing system ATP-binding protein